MPLNINWQQILLHLLNLVILAVGLYLILYKPVKKFMQKREDGYKEREEKTKAALDEAESKKEEYTSRLALVDEESARKREEADREMAKVREEKLAEAGAQAQVILEQGDRRRDGGKGGDDLFRERRLRQVPRRRRTGQRLRPLGKQEKSHQHVQKYG